MRPYGSVRGATSDDRPYHDIDARNSGKCSRTRADLWGIPQRYSRDIPTISKVAARQRRPKSVLKWSSVRDRIIPEKQRYVSV